MKIFETITVGRILLALIIVLAFSLRVLGIDAGLPLFTFAPDEVTIVRGAMEVWESEIPEGLGWPGTFYTFVLSLSYLVQFAAGHAADIMAGISGDRIGLLEAFDDYYMRFYADPTPQYIIARVWSVLFGAATIPLVFLTARRLYGSTAGILAAAILASSALHISHARMAVPDITMAFFVAATLYLVVRYWQEGLDRDYWAAAVMVGFAVANKFNGGVAILVLLSGQLASYGPAASWAWRRLIGRRTILAVGIAAVSFYLATPYLVTAPSVLLKEVVFSILGEGARELSVPTLAAAMRDVSDGVGWVALLGVGLAVVWLFFRGGRGDFPTVVVLLTCLIYLLPFAISPRRSDYYLLAILPLVSVAAGYGFAATWSHLGLTTPRFDYVRASLVIAVVPLLITGVTQVYSTTVELYDPHPAHAAKRWIERHVDPGARIAVEDSRVPLTANSVSIERTLARLRDDALIRDEKTRRIAGPEGYPGVSFSNVVINDEKVIRRKYEYLLKASLLGMLPQPAYDVITFTGGTYVTSIDRPKLYAMVDRGELDWVVSVHANPALGDLTMEWPGIWLYRTSASR